MGTRIKTFDSTGTAPNGRLYAGDLNAIQDQYADLMNLAQTHGVGVLQIGESGLQLSRFGAGEARISGALRADGIIRGLGGLFAGSFTTTQRNAIPLGSRPYGLIILNTTTNQYEWNAGTDPTPNWQPISPPSGTVGTAGIADGAVTSLKIADGTIVYADIANSLKPSVSALVTDEALRALGTVAGTAAAGNDSRLAYIQNAIFGKVASNGGIVAGGGFTVTHPATGQYNISFNSAMAVVPSVVATCVGGAAVIAAVTGVTVNGFTVFLTASGDWSGPNTGTDLPFDFHAFPPK